MQKSANRILSALLVLVMVLSMLPATVFATGETGSALENWDLTLGSNISVNFYFDKAYTVETTIAGEPAANAAAEKDGKYVVTVAVPAAQMTDTIGLTALDGEVTVHTGEYSIRQYAETLLAGNADAEVKEMVQKMLNYGAAAQVFFDHNADDLACDIVNDAAVPAEGPAIVVEDGLDGIDMYGASLVHADTLAVRFYFSVSGNVADYTFSTGTPVSKDSYYYVEVSDILPQDIDEAITMEVSKGESKLTVSYSPLTYIVRKYQAADSSEELKQLVQALYGYHLEALDYQKYQQIIQVGALQQHTNNTPWVKNENETFIYLNTDAYTGTTGEYTSLTADAIKLVRGGETYNVANPGQGLLVKDNDTQHLLKLTPWGITGGHLPIQAHDYFIIEGRFESTSGDGTTINIAKSYIYYDGTNVTVSETEPTIPVTIDAGTLNKHSSNGWAANGVYATMAENAAPFDAWSVEYSPVASENLKLIRGGETYNIGFPGRGTLVKYSATEYFLKMEWNVGDYAPMQDGDILIVEGGFVNETSKVTLNIAKTYIYANGSNVEFSTEMPTLSTTIDAGMMSNHSNGWNADALYFSMEENAAPIGDSIRYIPDAASNIKLIRDGATYDVGHTARETIVKSDDTTYYIALWTLGDYKPLVANDILVVEGNFTNAANKTTLNITKTYVLINADGTAEFSTEMPTMSSTVEGGVMQTHPNSHQDNGIYFKLDANEAPFDSWNYEYKQTTTTGVKLIRNGATTAIGIVGRPLFVKYNDTEYFLKLEGWTLGAYGWDNQSSPITTDDVLIIEGGFIHEDSKTTLNITKSYVYYDGSAWVCAANLPVEVDCGVMTEHADGTPDEIYFSMDANSVPVDEDIAYPYAGTVQLVTGSDVASVNAAIYKIAEDQYYLELDGAQLADQSYLIVEGAFVNGDNGYTMNITRTYVLNDGGSLVFSTTEPVFETEFAVTGLTNHGNGWASNGIYISHNAHSAYYDTTWAAEYKPVSAEVIKLVRGGETYNIGQPASGTLVVYGDTQMFFKTESWTVQGGVLPFVDGDQIIIEGKFKHDTTGNILVVEKTVICVDGDSLIFNPIFAGTMADHPNGVSGEGIYATMAENAAPYDNWSIEYTPATEDAYYVIRNGEQINIGKPGRGTLVKYSATEYFLKINAWCTDNFAYTTDDIIVIDGFWKQNTGGNAIVKIEKTYLYYDGSAWVFSQTMPVVVQGGVMKTHGNGMSGNGMYFAMDANAAPYNGDWTLEYTQTSVDGIKIIRNGETISIGIVDRPLFVKTDETNYYLKLEKWTVGEYGLNGGATPITTDDVIIIEGNFKYENVTLNISKSYVYYDGTAWICSAEAPVIKNVVDVVELGSHSNGWTSGGFYFTAAENTAPFDTEWALRYTPVSSDAIKLVHNGTTTNVGNTGGETIVKYSATEYFIEGWTVGMGNVVAGDQMIIEGQFYNKANDVYIDIEKTTITFNADGSTTVISESSKYINVGAMSAYVAGPDWYGDGIHFTLGSNIAPADAEWTVRYMPKNAANIKLIRGGETVNIANTGAETIVKIADGWYWLSLESWWWNAYAPIQDGDMLVIEGEFYNASNGYTLNIDKTYITFVSKTNDDVQFSVATETEFGDVLLPSSNKTLNIGVWNGSYHVFADKQLKELQDAGITKIMGIDTQWIGTTDVNAWLDRVYSYGIKVIFDLRSWDGVTVPDYANHPGVIGFLMYDEPCATDFDDLATLKGKFDAVMPADKLFYVNLYPSCAAGTSLVGAIDWALGYRDYDQYYVQKFLDKLDIEVLSWDNYSLLNGNGIRTDYFYNFEVMASKTGVEKWYTMLSSGHGTTSASYATPSADELRWQMAVAMTYGVSNIDHYTYVSHESDYSCMVEYDTWEPTDLYYDIKTVDNEYLAWDNIYMAYNWLGTAGVKAGSSSTMLDKLTKNISLTDNGLAAVATNKDVLVGVFENSGNKAYMVTNAGSAGSTTVGDGKNFTMEDATVTLTLGEGSYKCVAVIENGEVSYVAVNADNTVTLNVQAYEGVFVIPVLN